MTDVRPLENESSDSELSEGWDIVAQADVCAADVSSDGESVEVLEHEEADSSHAEDGDITQSEGSVEGEPNVEDAESFEEIPSTATDIMSVEGEHATSDMVLFSAEVRKRRQNWLQQSTERPIIVKTMRRYDRQFGQFDNCCLQYGLYLGTLCFCIVVLVFAALVIHFPSRIESNHVASTVKAKDDMIAPDSVKETYQYQNNKKEQIPHVDSKQQSLDTILEEQFKKILAQLESNQKNSLPVLSEGNNQASERKDSYLVNSDTFANRISNDNVEPACLKDMKVDSSSDNTEDCDPRDNRKFRYQNTLYFDYDELGSTFEVLGELTSSDVSKFQLGQSAMMLSTLNNNLKQLEYLISNSFDDEFTSRIKRQRHRLTNLLIKVVRYGISNAVDRLAWNIYDKVKKVERSIQNQWCKFENKIVALDGNTKIPFEKCGNRNNNNGETRKERLKKMWSESLNIKNEYQVDKDSVGKDCNKHSVYEGDDYKNIVKNKEHNKKTICVPGSDKNQNTNNKNKKYSNSVDKKQSKKELPKEQNKRSKKKYKKSSRKSRNSSESQSQKPHDQFKKQPEVNLNQWRRLDADNSIVENKFVYEKIKSEHTCYHNGKTVECTANFIKESGGIPPQQYGNVKYEVGRECDELTSNNCKQTVIDIEKSIYTDTMKTPVGSDKRVKGIQQWSFVIDESKVGNSSGVSGDWFIKSGEARSKIRNSNHKSDWLFERAKGRQITRQDYYSTAMWFFRRAYARHQCRLTPNLPWCQWQKQTIKTFPANSYFR